MSTDQERIEVYDAKHFPVISAYANKLGLATIIDNCIKGEMETSPGQIVTAIVLDALSYRSPLFRIKEFFCK